MAEYIEREALIAEYDRVHIGEAGGARKLMIEAPACDVVEVVHGEWVDVQYTYYGAKRYECSQCRDDEFWKKRYIEIKENYCPNCGAKMDGDKK